MAEQAPDDTDEWGETFPPISTGSLTEPTALLVRIEKQRITGTLHFRSAGEQGFLSLVGGMIAEDQTPTGKGNDPVDVLLSATAGDYALYQKLRPLPVSSGTDQKKTGSLSVHVTADLMNYCETGGVTGTLLVENSGRRAVIRYKAGELDVIELDGSEEQDLHNVFAWDEGSFSIELDSSLTTAAEDPASQTRENISQDRPDGSPSPGRREPTGVGHRGREATGVGALPGGREPTGVGFLNVVEVALDSILAEREKRRSPTRSSPPMPAAPKVRSSVSGEFEAMEDSGSKREPTVRVIYLGDAETTAPPLDTSTRHVGGRGSDESANRYLIDPLVEAADVRRPSEDGAGNKPSLLQRSLISMGWMMLLLMLMFGALIFLANLPSL